MPYDIQLDAVIDRAIGDKRIVGAVVLVSRNGELIYRRAAGYANRENQTPMREATLLRVASVTKPYVSAAVMALVERGAVSLDDKVTHFLPDLPPEPADGSVPPIALHQL